MPDIAEQPKIEAPESVELEHEETSVEADDKAFEKLPAETRAELSEPLPHKEIPEKATSGVAGASVSTPQRKEKDEVQIKVEEIMEEGMGTLYAELPLSAKQAFRVKGEQAAEEISEMIRTFKFQVAKVVRLLRNWLLTIPKVNRFFLEQEAKIKTDRILELVEAKKEETNNQSDV
ncbi:MAG: hypothetical protein ABII13_00905 [Patescibacteria group bacterium]